MTGAGRRACVAGICIAVSAVLGTPALADPEPPTAAQLAAEAERQAAELQREQEQEAAAREAAAATLEASQRAQRRADAAALAAAAAADRLRVAELRTAAARTRLDDYASSLYRRGAGSARLDFYKAVTDVRAPEEFFNGLGLAKRVGGTQANAVVELTEAQAAQERQSERVAAASAALREASARAAEARAAADRVVTEAAQRVAERSAALAATEQAAAEAAQREALLARAEQIARERSGAPLEAVAGALAPRPEATCSGGTLTGSANGRLPTAALCPLWGTRGHMLRTDAAAAFDAMSRAYAATFGAPLCVTDSYRDYGEQVAVAQAKPTLAAVPGTSNHGWGVALDLCDGVQDFASAQHAWMVEHSMAFGWFHPKWAQRGGSKPEPWHWEFAG